MAVMRGMVKFLLQWEREAQVSGGEPVFDHEFIAERQGRQLRRVEAT